MRIDVRVFLVLRSDSEGLRKEAEAAGYQQRQTPPRSLSFLARPLVIMRKVPDPLARNEMIEC